MNLSSYIKIQKFLLATFFVSVAAFTLSYFILLSSPYSAAINANNANGPFPTPTKSSNSVNTPVNNQADNKNADISNPGADLPENPNEGDGYGLMIIGGVSFLTSLTSLLGFISTTVLAWRKEKRDVEAIRLENEKKEIELMKLRFELEKIKGEEKPDKEKTSKPAPRKRKKPE